ncbi:hypothetical protein BH23GEM7_BH23GEM7_27090 [soil metagenome]|jgi:hypothetical protein
MDAQQFRLRHDADGIKEQAKSQRWVDETEERIIGKLNKDLAQIHSDDPRFRSAQVEYASRPSASGWKPNKEHLAALKARFLSRGWHKVEVEPEGAYVILSVLRLPIIITLVDETSFEAEAHENKDLEEAAAAMAREGVWRYRRNGAEFILPHRIASVHVQPLGPPTAVEAPET